MRKNISLSFLMTAIVLSSSSCNKDQNPIEYNGEVVRNITDCTVASGFPYIIKYTATNNITDSLITASLPSSFHLLGSKIYFKINDKISNLEAMVCTGLFSYPTQKSIYDVRTQ